MTGRNVEGSNSIWGTIFRTGPDRPLGPTQPPIQCVADLSRGQSDLVVALPTQPHLTLRLKNE